MTSHLSVAFRLETRWLDRAWLGTWKLSADSADRKQLPNKQPQGGGAKHAGENLAEVLNWSSGGPAEERHGIPLSQLLAMALEATRVICAT
jgi:hypothetical protein